MGVLKKCLFLFLIMAVLNIPVSIVRTYPTSSEAYEITDIQGVWVGNWEGFSIDPSGDLKEDQDGGVSFNITQVMTDGPIYGTATITGWNVLDDWDGENEEVNLLGWIDQYNKWFFLKYNYFEGEELLSDLSNLIADYAWSFENLDITETMISGSFRLRGTGDYYRLGTFSVSKDVPVPEPSTLLLLCTGLIGLVGIKKKFRS